MTSTPIAALLCCITLNIFAQNAAKTESFYLLDKDWKGTTDNSKAAYIARLTKENDTTWRWDVYHQFGPKISGQTYKDANLTVLNGDQNYFHLSGYLDSTGEMVNGEQHDNWYFYNDTGRVILKKSYEFGSLVYMTDFLTEKKEKKPKNQEQLDEKESVFPGGPRKWQQYLIRNMKFPERAERLNMTGRVIVRFIIDDKGKIYNPYLSKSAEFSMDEEALRLIRNSPAWHPGYSNGHPVQTFKAQPMEFNKEEIQFF